MSSHYQTEFFEEDYLDDISEIKYQDFENVAISTTDWTAETIVNQVVKGNILLSPSFQRRDAWTRDKKSLFIESMILNVPVPQLVLAESPKEKGKYIVLDGKQRLLSILQFSAVNKRDDYPKLVLKGLPILKEFNGKSYEDIVFENGQFSAFDNYTIRTSLIKNVKAEDILYQVFYRLNTGSLPLSPQELRFALQPGKFSAFLDRESSSLRVFRYVFDSNKPDFRMRDAELFLRHIANCLFLNNYSGNLKKFLDESYSHIASNYRNYENDLLNIASDLDKAHEHLLGIFGDDLYKKFKKGKFESRFNRSIFEVLVYFFSKDEVRSKVAIDKVRFKDELTDLMNGDNSFLNSLESSTKTVEAVQERFNGVAKILNNSFSCNFDELKLR